MIGLYELPAKLRLSWQWRFQMLLQICLSVYLKAGCNKADFEKLIKILELFVFTSWKQLLYISIGRPTFPMRKNLPVLIFLRIAIVYNRAGYKTRKQV